MDIPKIQRKIDSQTLNEFNKDIDKKMLNYYPERNESENVIGINSEAKPNN